MTFKENSCFAKSEWTDYTHTSTHVHTHTVRCETGSIITLRDCKIIISEPSQFVYIFSSINTDTSMLFLRSLYSRYHLFLPSFLPRVSFLPSFLRAPSCFVWRKSDDCGECGCWWWWLLGLVIVVMTGCGGSRSGDDSCGDDDGDCSVMTTGLLYTD